MFLISYLRPNDELEKDPSGHARQTKVMREADLSLDGEQTNPRWG
jgi:hypothetical protein